MNNELLEKIVVHICSNIDEDQYVDQLIDKIAKSYPEYDTRVKHSRLLKSDLAAWIKYSILNFLTTKELNKIFSRKEMEYDQITLGKLKDITTKAITKTQAFKECSHSYYLTLLDKLREIGKNLKDINHSFNVMKWRKNDKE